MRRSPGRPKRGLVTAAAAAFLAGVAAAATIACCAGVGAHAQADALAQLKAQFRRPAAVPFPATNPFTEDKRALGERLFHDKRLSVDGSIACASCHQRAKGFADGRRHGRGVPGVALKRHTPTLWNLAWAGPVFWDARARSLEEQIAGPIEAPDEMGQPVASVVALLAGDPAYARAFAAAFPDDPRVTPENLAKALATFERTLVSPPTRFDRWIDGDAHALSADEIAGFHLFAGKAKCSNCHSGWAFTDSAFHDIGLPSEDRGRGAVLRLPAAEHAFKTPSLREIGRSAPYMHDGSLATLDRVVRHYERGIVARPTLSADLPRDLKLTERERRALIGFLGTLTGERTAPSPVVATIARERAPGRTRAHCHPEREEFPSDPRGGAARRAPVGPQQRHPHPQHPGVRSGVRFRLRRPGAGRNRRDRVPGSRLVPGVLRHPSKDGAHRRRRPVTH